MPVLDKEVDLSVDTTSLVLEDLLGQYHSEASKLLLGLGTKATFGLESCLSNLNLETSRYLDPRDLLSYIPRGSKGKVLGTSLIGSYILVAINFQGAVPFYTGKSDILLHRAGDYIGGDKGCPRDYINKGVIELIRNLGFLILFIYELGVSRLGEVALKNGFKRYNYPYLNSQKALGPLLIKASDTEATRRGKISKMDKICREWVSVEFTSYIRSNGIG